MTAASGRAFIYPLPGETLEKVAERVLGASLTEAGDRYADFLSWNVHLSNGVLSHITLNETSLLPSELIYTEPPRAEPGI